MSKTVTFYVREGRRYRPVREYDPEFMDAKPHGAHVTVVRPHGSITRYNIEPDLAPMIAAGTIAADAISEVLVRASEFRLDHKEQIGRAHV